MKNEQIEILLDQVLKGQEEIKSHLAKDKTNTQSDSTDDLLTAVQNLEKSYYDLNHSLYKGLEKLKTLYDKILSFAPINKTRIEHEYIMPDYTKYFRFIKRGVAIYILSGILLLMSILVYNKSERIVAIEDGYYMYHLLKMTEIEESSIDEYYESNRDFVQHKVDSVLNSRTELDRIRERLEELNEEKSELERSLN